MHTLTTGSPSHQQTILYRSQTLDNRYSSFEKYILQ